MEGLLQATGRHNAVRVDHIHTTEYRVDQYSTDYYTRRHLIN